MIAFGMHKHLRAWRLSRKLSQEQVGNILGKRHTTIGRWEKGVMKLTTADLEALATAYGVSVRQLMAPPDAADHVRLLERFQDAIEGADPADVEAWLNMLERIKR